MSEIRSVLHRKALAVMLLKDDPWQSNRRVAATVGLDRKAVGTIRRGLVEAGDVAKTATTVRPGHSRALHQTPVAVRLARRLDTSGGPTACWPFLGYREPKWGYGRIGDDAGVSRSAHRVAWEVANGPIPDGLFACHHCDNPPCCNPAHLFLGTSADNTDDKMAKGRYVRGTVVRGESHGRARLTDEDVIAIRSSTASMTELAGVYGVNRTTVSAAFRRRSWTHL